MCCPTLVAPAFGATGWGFPLLLATEPAKTVVIDTLYRADGTPASGTLVISWPAFVSADGKPVAAGSLTVKVRDGAVNLPLVPTQGATPAGTYYKVVVSLDDGAASQEYWAVPTLSPTNIASIRSSVVPATVAMQVVSREYVDGAIAAAVGTGNNPLALSKGGTGQSTWTSSRCVRVASDGASLESAPDDCSGSSANADTVDGKHAADLQGKLSLAPADYGCAGNGIADDTACLQALLNEVGVQSGGGPHYYEIRGKGNDVYKVTKSLLYEGQVGRSALIHFGGAQIMWCGPKNDAVLHTLGVNNLWIEHLHLVAYCNGAQATTSAKYGIWFDATNDSSNSSNGAKTISSISRDANGLLTVTTSVAHGWTPGTLIKIAGVSPADFNGYVNILYSDSATAFVAIQGGPAESGSGGTADRYQSNASNGLHLKDVQISIGAAQSSAISTVVPNGNSTVTVTTTTAHLCSPNDYVVIKGTSVAALNSDTNDFYGHLVPSNGVTDSTHLIVNFAGSNGLATGNGGTLLCDNAAVAYGGHHSQVSEGTGDHLILSGNAQGTSISGLKWNDAGNNKDYAFNDLQTNGFWVGINNLASGSLNIHHYGGGNNHLEFAVGNAQLTFLGGETESNGIGGVDGSRIGVFYGAGDLFLSGFSYQARTPADDVGLILGPGSAATLVANYFANTRGSGHPMRIQASQLAGGSGGQSLNSFGNTYSYAPAGGVIPVYNSTGSQIFTDGSYTWTALNVSSWGDLGGDSGQNPMRNIPATMNMLQLAAELDGSGIIATTGNLRMTKTATMKYRCNNNTDCNALSLNADDSLQLGGPAGISVSKLKTADGSAVANLNADLLDGKHAAEFTGAPVSVPANASSSCVAGQWAYNTNYVYLCVAANTWRRAALSSW